MRLNILGRIRVARARLLAAALAVALLCVTGTFAAQVIYEYDEAGRLRYVIYDEGKQVDYVLDAVGNRTLVKIWNTPPVPVISDVISWSNNGSFTVTWSMPSTPVVITRYELYEGVDGGAFGTTPLVNSLVTSYSATGRAQGRYYYRVRACSADGCGRYATWTNSFNVDLTAPAPVTGVSASALASTTATVGWNVTTDNFEIQDYQYRVVPSQTWISVGTALSAGLTGLTPQTEYTAQVRARDRANNASTLSSTTFTTARPIPTAPTNLATNQVADCAWRASWTASAGATSYTVRDTQGAEQNTTSTEFIVSCPQGQPDANKPYWVRACNANGCSARAFFGINDTIPPSQPGVLMFNNVLHNAANVTWAASTDNVLLLEYDYRLNGGQWITVPGNSASITGLAVATTYNMEVRAVDAVGLYSPIRSGSFTTLSGPDATPPNAPPAASVSNILSNQVTVNWTAATDNVGVTGYRFRPTIFPTWTEVGNVLAGTQTGLTPSTPYTIEVQARDATGNWSASRQTAPFTTAIGPPPMPTGLAMNHAANCAWNTSWNASITATSYVVQDTNGGEVTTSNTFASVSCPLNDPEANKPRYVRACNASGCSANAQFTPPASGDTSAPTQPGALTISAVTTTSATVTWGASSDNVAVTSYEYQLNSGSWLNVGLSTTANLTGLSAATSYSFGVRARDAANNVSSTRTGTINTDDPVPPSQPGAVTFTLVTGTTATANWVASTDNVGVTGYDYRLNAGPWIPLGNVTSVALSSLTGATTYTFEVRAKDGTGNLSVVRSAPLTTADATPPSQPGAVTISLITATTARATWGGSTDNVAVTAYDYRLNGGSWIPLANVTLVDLSGLTQATSYTFEVRARDGAGNPSLVRAASPFTTLDGTAPSQPGVVTISAITGSTATATWGASSDNVGVTAYEYRLNGGGWVNAGAVTTIGLTGLAEATNYTFEVQARDAAGNTSLVRTAPVFATLDVTAPSQPGAVTISLVTATTARATWGGSTDNVAVTAYDYRLNGGSWNPLANVTLVDLSGLTQVTSYTFEVRARDGAGNPSLVRAASPFTTLDGTAPSQPGVVTISAITGSTATATWGASSDNIAVTAYEYRLNGGGWVNAGTVTTIGLTGLAEATNYTFEVQARDAAGNTSLVRTAPMFATLDVTAPSLPGAVTISLVTATTARATWGGSTDNVAVIAYDYRLNGGSWNPLANVTLVDLSGLTQATSYAFEVRARDGAGNPSQVRAASPFTTLDGTAPSQPGAVTISAITGSTATATWGASSDNVAVTAYEYRLNGGGWVNAGAVTTIGLTGLAEATNYTFEVQARDAAGNTSLVRTAPVFATLDVSAPSTPGVLTITPQSFSATISWGGSSDNVGIFGYDYRLTTSASWTNAGTATGVTLGSLSPQTGYTFEVRARDLAGNLSGVRSGSFTTLVAPPVAPTNLAYNHVADCAWSTSWSAVAGATSYIVRDTQGTEYPTTSTSYSINCPLGNPEANKPRWVKACNIAGCSNQADFAPSGGDGMAPTQPGVISVTNLQPTSATVNWAASTDNVGVTGYYYRLDSGGWIPKNNSPTVNLSGLQDNRTYTFDVYAIDAAGNSSPVRSGSFTTPLGPDVSPPSAPGSVTISGFGSTNVSFTWTAASDNVGVNQYDYRVTSSPTWVTVGAGTLSASINGLASSTQYTVEVRARDSAGNVGPSRLSAPFTTLAGAPSVPTGVNKNLVADCSWRAEWYAPSTGIPTYFEWRQTNGTQEIINVTAQTSYPIQRSANCEQGNSSSNMPDWVRACNGAGCSLKVNFP